MKSNVHLWHSSFQWRQRATRYELKLKKQLTKHAETVLCEVRAEAEETVEILNIKCEHGRI